VHVPILALWSQLHLHGLKHRKIKEANGLFRCIWKSHSMAWT